MGRGGARKGAGRKPDINRMPVDPHADVKRQADDILHANLVELIQLAVKFAKGYDVPVLDKNGKPVIDKDTSQPKVKHVEGDKMMIMDLLNRTVGKPVEKKEDFLAKGFQIIITTPTKKKIKGKEQRVLLAVKDIKELPEPDTIEGDYKEV